MKTAPSDASSTRHVTEGKQKCEGVRPLIVSIASQLPHFSQALVRLPDRVRCVCIRW